MDEPGFKWRHWLTAHVDHMMLDSIAEKWGIRFFVAHLQAEEINEDRFARLRNMVFVDQLWVVTLH